MFSLLIILATNLVSSSVFSFSESRNSASSAMYRQFHKVIGIFEREAQVYRRTASQAEECMEDFQVICETLRCRRRTPLIHIEELQIEKQLLLEKCNRLERERISQMQALKVILGDCASPIFDYFESMEKSMSKSLKRAIGAKDWRRVVSLQASIDMLKKDKNLIVQIYVEERAATTESAREATFATQYNTSRSVSRRRFSK